MADFCRYSSIALFGDDYGDLKGLCKEGEMVTVICEGCGVVNVDHDGIPVNKDVCEFYNKDYVQEWEKWESRLKGRFRWWWRLFDSPLGPGQITWWRLAVRDWWYGPIDLDWPLEDHCSARSTEGDGTDISSPGREDTESRDG